MNIKNQQVTCDSKVYTHTHIRTCGRGVGELRSRAKDLLKLSSQQHVRLQDLLVTQLSKDLARIEFEDMPPF